MAAASHLDILERAKPYVTQLVEATGETAHLGVLRQGEVVSLVNVESRYTVRTPATVGRHIPLHCTSQGKAILAFLPPTRWRVGLKGYVFSKHSANTIVSKDRFWRIWRWRPAAATRWTTRNTKKGCAALRLPCATTPQRSWGPSVCGPDLSRGLVRAFLPSAAR